MTTYPLDKPRYFLLQDSASEVSYAYERSYTKALEVQTLLHLTSMWHCNH